MAICAARRSPAPPAAARPLQPFKARLEVVPHFFQPLLKLLILTLELLKASGQVGKLLLKPVNPVNVLGFKIQGLLPRRQADLAERISEAIAKSFLKEEDILVFLRKVDPAQAMRQLVLDKWEEKVGELLNTM